MTGRKRRAASGEPVRRQRQASERKAERERAQRNVGLQKERARRGKNGSGKKERNREMVRHHRDSATEEWKNGDHLLGEILPPAAKHFLSTVFISAEDGKTGRVNTCIARSRLCSAEWKAMSKLCAGAFLSRTRRRRITARPNAIISKSETFGAERAAGAHQHNARACEHITRRSEIRYTIYNHSHSPLNTR